MWRNRGFTLIELLVALAIFAIMSGFAYRGLTAMLESREALSKESRKWRDVSLFVGRIERDLAALLLRRHATSASGTKLAALSSAIDSSPGPSGLALSRSGNMLAGNASAAPQRVAYRLREGRVERLDWGGIDAAPRDDPAGTPVLANVSGLAFRFLDPKNLEWRAEWGIPGNAAEPPPAAVEMTLTLASGERIVRLFDLPRQP
jgi:general secretion pathway protein J